MTNSPRPYETNLPGSLVDLVSDDVRSLSAYHVPRFGPTQTWLHANESPYSLPADLRSKLAEQLANAPLNRYPDPSADLLRNSLSRLYGCEKDQLVIGNGSDELISMLLHAFARPREGKTRASILVPTPSFVFYRLAAAWAGVNYVAVPLTEEFELNLEAVDHAIAEHQPNICFFALPNNPTGTLWPLAHVRTLAAAHPKTVFVSDEAYGDYAQESLLSSVSELPNLLVMRTLSKIGLASLRLGALIAQPAVAHHIERVRPPYNVGGLNQLAAAWVLDNAADHLRNQCNAVISERESLFAGLSVLPNVKVFPSRANLLLLRIGSPGDGHATLVWRALADEGILVRNFDLPGSPIGPLSGCLRVTIGSPPENALFLARFGHHLGLVSENR